MMLRNKITQLFLTVLVRNAAHFDTNSNIYQQMHITLITVDTKESCCYILKTFYSVKFHYFAITMFNWLFLFQNISLEDKVFAQN